MYNHKGSIEGTITIVTTDGVNPTTQTLEGVSIVTECGEGSTTIEAPDLLPLYQVPNHSVLSIDGTFGSNNPECPIQTHNLLEGEDYYDLTETGAEPDLGFTVTMEEDDNQVEDTYTYVVEAIAEGGNAMQITGTKEILSVCVADAITSWNKTIEIVLPDVDSEEDGAIVTFPSSGNDYVTPLPSGEHDLTKYLPEDVTC